MKIQVLLEDLGYDAWQLDNFLRFAQIFLPNLFPPKTKTPDILMNFIF